MNTFEDYLNQLDNPEHAAKLERIFDWIEKQYPELEKVIKWNQPMYIYNGTYIIGFSTAKGHISISPEQATIQEYEEEIDESGYSQSKMIFRIKWTQDVDYSLFEKLIDYQLKEKENYPKFWRSVK